MLSRSRLLILIPADKIQAKSKSKIDISTTISVDSKFLKLFM